MGVEVGLPTAGAATGVPTGLGWPIGVDVGLTTAAGVLGAPTGVEGFGVPTIGAEGLGASGAGVVGVTGAALSGASFVSGFFRGVSSFLSSPSLFADKGKRRPVHIHASEHSI